MSNNRRKEFATDHSVDEKNIENPESLELQLGEDPAVEQSRKFAEDRISEEHERYERERQEQILRDEYARYERERLEQLRKEEERRAAKKRAAKKARFEAEKRAREIAASLQEPIEIDPQATADPEKHPYYEDLYSFSY